MKIKPSYFVWPLVLAVATGMTAACSSSGSSSGGKDGSGGDGGQGGAGAASGGESSETGGSSSAGKGGAAGEGGAMSDLCAGVDCPDDGNACTEDVCNPEDGTCGIPRTGTKCNDGVFCNGEDTCDAGECTEHEGDPCGGGVCNEANDACECDSEDDCPDDAPDGDWGECMFPTECGEDGKQQRPVKTYTCGEEGMCVVGAIVEEQDCTRETDGNDCQDDTEWCTGAEKCSGGLCVSEGDPCAANPDTTDACWEGGDKCVECTDNGSCLASEKCCNRVCIPDENTCGIVINPDLINPDLINPDFINPNFTF